MSNAETHEGNPSEPKPSAAGQKELPVNGVQSLKIDEFVAPDGLLAVVHLHWDGVTLSISDSQATLAVPLLALGAIMTRFGGPLDVDERVHTVAGLDLGSAGRLRHVRHLSGYDVVARDYLLYERAGHETLCCLAVTVAGALIHLGRAAADSRPTTDDEAQSKATATSG